MSWQKLKQRWRESQPCARRAALITVLLGLVLWRLPQGDWFVHWSFDLPTLLAPTKTPQEVLMIQIDEPTLTELGQSYQYFNRTNHVKLLEKLTAAPARLVVFDIFFPESPPHPENGEFARAIQANGRVVLAADYTRQSGLAADTITPPVEILKQAARERWGISSVDRDTDLAIRSHYLDPESRYSSLAWAAAETANASITQTPNARLAERWLRYYGNHAIPSMRYSEALQQQPEHFKEKFIFIGGKPNTRNLLEAVDEFATPYTHWGGPRIAGVEFQATAFLNLLRNEWQTRMPASIEFLLLVLSGSVLGFGLSLVRPRTGTAVAAAIALATGVIACLLFWYAHFWFSWLLIAGAQIPSAWGFVAVWNLQRLYRDKAELEKELRGPQTDLPPPTASPWDVALSKAQAPSASTPPGQAPIGAKLAPVIPNYDLLRSIGEGGFGEVFLARSTIGLYHAVKVVRREKFRHAGPYEREYHGVQTYMPVSLNHSALVHLLHVGRDDEAGYFYYVMELGDDESTGAKIDPVKYMPRNLSQDLHRRGHLPVAECVNLLLSLTEALDYLHQEKLVHRDIKPSNIIFVKGVPKFADIGLVTGEKREGHDVSQVGTKGYMAPEGVGTAVADVYSLGIVLYRCATGLEPDLFPELPATLPEGEGIRVFMQLNRIILKACQTDLGLRYPSAKTMRADLLSLAQQIPDPDSPSNRTQKN